MLFETVEEYDIEIARARDNLRRAVSAGFIRKIDTAGNIREVQEINFNTARKYLEMLLDEKKILLNNPELANRVSGGGAVRIGAGW